MNEGVLQTCIDGKHFGLSFDYVGVSRHPDRHQIEFFITAVVRICRQLTGSRFVPERVQLTHHRTTKAELAEIFGDHIEFGASVDEIILPSELRNSRVVSADPYLNNLLTAYCEEALAHRKRKRGSFQSAVENAIAPLLPHGKATAADVARQLGLSQRTFATSVDGRHHLFRIAGKPAIRSRQSLSRGRRHGCFGSRLAAGLSRSRFVFACFPAVDRQNPTRGVARGTIASVLSDHIRSDGYCWLLRTSFWHGFTRRQQASRVSAWPGGGISAQKNLSVIVPHSSSLGARSRAAWQRPIFMDE